MLGNLPDIDRTVRGIGVLVGSQRPFIRFLIQNWPLAVVAGFAMYSKGRERWKKNELTTYNTLADLGLVLSPLVGLALINQLAQNQQMGVQPVAQPPPVQQG